VEICISTTPNSITSRLTVARHGRTADVYGRLTRRLHRKSAKRRLVRICFIGFNLVMLGLVVFFVATARSSATKSAVLPLANASSTATAAINPLDQVSSADIAVTVSRLAALSETTAITNQAQSADVALSTAPTTNDVVSKPEVVATSFQSKDDIQEYAVQPGDTVSSIASKFNVTSSSIQWSNSLTGNGVTAGTKLVIPPVGLSGIVYTVKAGDTLDSLASKYKADKNELIAANDAELTGISPGELIIIPNGQQPVVTYSYASSASYGGYAYGTAAIYGFNGYDYGYCTWYVASQIAVPSNWGNASTWAIYAAQTPGWSVSSTPTVGAIAETPYAAGGEGHVAIVDGVSADGTQIEYKDMNGIAGWGRVGQSGWVSSSLYPSYITKS
jgi:surface antigen